MKEKTVACEGFEQGDKVSHIRHGFSGEVLEVTAGNNGYILVKWDNGVMAYYGRGAYRNDISDISLIV